MKINSKTNSCVNLPSKKYVFFLLIQNSRKNVSNWTLSKPHRICIQNVREKVKHFVCHLCGKNFWINLSFTQCTNCWTFWISMFAWRCWRYYIVKMRFNLSNSRIKFETWGNQIISGIICLKISLFHRFKNPLWNDKKLTDFFEDSTNFPACISCTWDKDTNVKVVEQVFCLEEKFY